jgi:DNA-binding IclR family transcriptional regulator
MLAAVDAGRAELSISCEPDLFIDGLCCCDQHAAHTLARTGLFRPAATGRVGQRVPAELTPAGAAALAGGDPSEYRPSIGHTERWGNGTR